MVDNGGRLFRLVAENDTAACAPDPHGYEPAQIVEERIARVSTVRSHFLIETHDDDVVELKPFR